MEEKLREVLRELYNQETKLNFKEESSRLTTKYKLNKGGSGGILGSKQEIVTYAQVRMPATFACVKKVIEGLKLDELKSYSLLDVGFGTGAGTIAVLDRLKISSVTAVEKQQEMLNLGKIIIDKIIPELKINYVNQDVVDYKTNKTFDITLASFILNELSIDKAKRLVCKLFEITSDYLLILDPGTPANHQRMQEIKEELIKAGGKLIAPCKSEKCPLVNDYCHFIARVRRTKQHKEIKNATESYEDEKFSYLVFSKQTTNGSGFHNRVIRRPIIKKGNITHTICGVNGIEYKTFSKKLGEEYKLAKKLEVGDEY